MNLHVGQRLMLIPDHLVDEMGRRIVDNPKRPCTVVYINYKHRFFTVAFDFNGHIVREAYKFSFHRGADEQYGKMLIW